MQEKIAVIGGGSWGTALGKLVAENGYQVCLYAKENEVVESINNQNENAVFMPGIKLHKNMRSKNLEEISEEHINTAIWAVPTQFSRAVAGVARGSLKNASILIATKGIEIETCELIFDILKNELESRLSILSGPSFAKEVANKKPTAVSIASKIESERKKWQKIVATDYFRAYTTNDVVGVEVGGAIKNIVAIATGISDGLGFGLNARAGLITRGLAEITRLGVALGANKETFMGLSGMGDLVLTSTGELSRNRNVGIKLAKGLSLNEILDSMKMVAEGVFTAKAAYNLAHKMNVEMPITTEVYKILYENKSANDSVMDLMRRDLKDERI